MEEHPIRITLEAVCGKWKALILWHLKEGTLRFGELNQFMPRVSSKMLTQQLRELEEDGLIERTVYKEVPPKVEYSLTQYGRDLKPTLEMLYKWGKNHRDILTGESQKAVSEES
ncbi:MAG TPA: helix-turn-helix domain-containing protein [Bacillales bacterium]|nr:helix-turn-helix domain-containing protein [Bacillales bacterium]